MIVYYEGWAPPGMIWGPWIEIAAVFGKYTYEVEVNSISNAPSTFNVEVKYWEGNLEKVDSFYGPNAHSFTLGQCACKARIRFRSHTIGQIIKIKVYQ